MDLPAGPEVHQRPRVDPGRGGRSGTMGITDLCAGGVSRRRRVQVELPAAGTGLKQHESFVHDRSREGGVGPSTRR
ncbi:MAG: hypothetical protein MZV64_16775 [Ignavibacteriales bacterium]|nr:hypothetical protein [Ignavibacteriales bacterium]